MQSLLTITGLLLCRRRLHRTLTMAMLSYCLATVLLLAGTGVRCQPAPAPLGGQAVKSFATDQVPEFDVLTEQAQR